MMSFRLPQFCTIAGSWRALPVLVIGVHVMPLALTVDRGAAPTSAYVRTTMVPMALDKLPASAFGDWE